MREYLLNFVRRLRRAVHRTEFERQLADELRAHVEAETDELIRSGIGPAEARRRAMAAFGGFDRWRDEVRETRLGHSLETFGRDARLALRALIRTPAYSLPTIASITLGIVALATIATLAYDVLLRPLPYDDPSRLVAVYERNIPQHHDRNVVSAAAMMAWRERSRTLDSVSGLMPSSRVWLTSAGPERLSGAEISPSLFAMLGYRPALGPGFSSSTADAHEVVVSHQFWTRRLGGDSAIIGKAIRLDGVPITVVGVMPSDFMPLKFGWMGEQEFWVPLVVGPQQLSWGRFLLIAARLRPGSTFESADRELHALHVQLRSEGSIADGWDTQLVPLTDELSGSVRAPLYALLVACGLLVVLVLTNTSLLTLAHARKRAPERALRSVLGATRGRLIAEGLTTSLIMALGGVLLGLAASSWTIPAMRRFLPVDVPMLARVHFGWVAVLVAASTGAIVAGVLAAIPAFDRRHDDDATTLHEGVRVARSGATSWVVIAEASAAVVLAVLAALTLRSFERLASVDVGFDASNLIAFRVGFDGQAASREFLGRLRAVPGVLSAGRTSVRPFYEGGTATTVTPPGFGNHERSAFPTADVRFVDAEYFRTLRLAPLQGRLFSTAEARGPLRVVVNETFGKTLWPNEREVVGRSFDLILNGTPTPEIIGVVRDVRLASPRNEPRPTVYIFTEQQTIGEEYDVLVRTSVPPSAIISDARRVAQSISGQIALFRVASMRETVDATIARERVTAQLLVFFAASALVLVAVGVYGLYAGEVARRRHEIGVRMALGATRESIVKSMLARALARTAVGVALGGAAAFAAARVLESVLYEVRSTDPLSYGGAALAVVIVALGATIIPAMQASTVDPSLAMRAE